MKNTAKKAKSETVTEVALTFTGDEAMTRLTDLTRRIVAVPKNEVINKKKRSNRKHRH